MTPSSPVNVGLRVKHARQNLRRMSQDALAAAMGFNDRQTVSDIETGKRAVKSDELLQLSNALDQDLEYFISPFSVVGEAEYSWRASSDVTEDALDSFEIKASGWIGMLRWLRAQSTVPHDPLGFSLRLNENSTFEQAQQAAELLVEKLALGLMPAASLADCIESRLDIPVLFVDMDQGLKRGSISGAACHLAELGAVLVNRQEPSVRRNFDLAHELFHTLTWGRVKIQHRESNSMEERKRTRRVEQLADNFASALLMPRASLDSLIHPARANEVVHLADVAAELQVSTTALGWRLRSLGRIDEPIRVALSQITRPDPVGETPKLFSAPFVRDLHAALDKGRLTMRKAASTLSLSQEQLLELFAAYQLSDPSSSWTQTE
ncbi:helix-turn-helix domain-containing protein [Roseateles terrae]|uniref:Zn-dependent peptidase ImmA (M78 family)/DNA-binding XRE family transcriptional regulator n=1 Tax=Roseateles terrae TaxID=431060 RepID=A0ABR6GMH6_9BURK|nr:XRE family transcriptional regulator [Roseateles terrae]MBB3193311.1 Zn-dependent peptidase ImmA (M78 family)/DNA-binding XRE family transcriptional regulator [Roseateles terrae]OWQ89484.1 DNA-binding protein [Roseateles terrae]